MPTGGVNAKNLTSYLDFPKIIACGGSWMVPGDLINAGEWDKIEQLTREAVQTMLGFELAHVGVNAENEEEAVKAANRFAFIFGMPAKVGNSSVFGRLCSGSYEDSLAWARTVTSLLRPTTSRELSTT